MLIIQVHAFIFSQLFDVCLFSNVFPQMVLFSLNRTILIKKENRTEKVRGNGEGGRMGGWEEGEGGRQ